MRLFIALRPPKKERTRIYRAIQVLREKDYPVHWIDLENFHLTMKFLGNIGAEQVKLIEAAMSKVASQTRAFSINLAGLGAFPSIRYPRLIWLGIVASADLRGLKQDLEWALADCGFLSETREFHPHITLGRASQSDGAGSFRGLDDLVAELDYRSEIKVGEIDLIHSHLSKNGPPYSVISSKTLSAA